MAKDQISRHIAYSEDGFDRKAVTSRTAKAIEPGIRKQDAEAWFEKQESQQLRRKSFYDSYVVGHKLQQIHAAIAYFR